MKLTLTYDAVKSLVPCTMVNHTMSPQEMPFEDVLRTQSQQSSMKTESTEIDSTAVSFRHEYPFVEDRSIHRVEVVQLTTNSVA